MMMRAFFFYVLTDVIPDECDFVISFSVGSEPRGQQVRGYDAAKTTFYCCQHKENDKRFKSIEKWLEEKE